MMQCYTVSGAVVISAIIGAPTQLIHMYNAPGIALDRCSPKFVSFPLVNLQHLILRRSISSSL